MRGSEREYDQAGVELIGASGALADAEAIGLLGDALAGCGLRSAEIDVGHVGYVGGFLAELAPPAREVAGRRIRDGDLVGALAAAREGGLAPARVRSLERGLRHRGSALAELRADAPAASLKALDELAAIGPLLEGIV